MNELLDLVFYALVGYIVARVLMSFIIKHLEAKNEKLKEQLVDLAKQFIFVKPEKHGDVIYLFDAHTDQFIAQGKNVDELKTHCRQRFPNKNIVVSNDYVESFAELKNLRS